MTILDKFMIYYIMNNTCFCRKFLLKFAAVEGTPAGYSEGLYNSGCNSD